MRTTSIPKILLTVSQVAEALSLCERTISAIPEEHLPRCRIGRAIRYRFVDIELLAENLASGEVVLGPVNG